MLPGEVDGGDGGQRLLVAPQHLLLEGDVGGQLDLLLDGGRLHSNLDTPVVSAQFAVNPTLASNIALSSSSTNKSGHITVNNSSPEETLEILFMKYFIEIFINRPCSLHIQELHSGLQLTQLHKLHMEETLLW